MTYYFDASIPRRVPEALAMIRADIKWAGETGCPRPNWPDEKWLPYAAERGWAVIMRDKRVRYRPGEREALRMPGLAGAFILTTAGSYSKWAILELLVQKWEAIEERVANPTGTRVYAVTQAGVRDLD